MTKCKLCLIETADIIPKFLGKSMLKQNDGKHSGIRLTLRNEDKIVKGNKIQDIYKKDYIFCPKCENHLSTLESFFANEIYHKIKDNLLRKSLNVSNTILIKRFISSLIWRTNLNKSKYPTSALSENIAEKLRKFVFSVNEECDFNFGMLFCKKNIPNENILTINQNEKMSLLAINEIMFITSFEANSSLFDGFFEKKSIIFPIEFLELSVWEAIRDLIISESIKWVKGK